MWGEIYERSPNYYVRRVKKIKNKNKNENENRNVRTITENVHSYIFEF